MAWNNGGPSPWGDPRPGGSGGNGPSNGPWGQPGGQGGPGGNRNQGGGPFNRGPDLDDIVRQLQEAARRVLPRGFGGGKGLGLAALALLAVWGASGFYRVQPDEQGVVMRFGAFDRIDTPGLNYHLPWPIEAVTTPRVTRINRVDVGFRGAADGNPLARPTPARDVVEESMMLTGDENIVDVDLAVFWRVRDVGEYLFNTRNPDASVKSAAESMVREVIGRTPIQPALGEARAQIETQVRQGAQAILDQYKAGVEVTQVQLLKVDPPAAVIEAFRDVQRASADRERARNEAEAYRNDIIPRARGEGERLVQEAQGFRESQIARSRGEAQRFVSVLTAYQSARDVTTQRLYLETMEEILRRNPTVLVDDRLQGLVPFLPLGDVGRPAGAAAPSPAAVPAPPQPAAPAARPAPVPPNRQALGGAFGLPPPNAQGVQQGTFR